MTALPAAARVKDPSRADASTKLTVEVQGNLGLSPPDGAGFDALVDARPAVGVFLSRAWLAGYFAEPPEGSDPLLVLLRDGESLRGITAVAVRRTLARVQVSLLGGGAGSDRVDLIAAGGFETACADSFVRWLQDAYGPKGFVLELRDVPADSPLWGALRRAASDGTVPAALEPRDIHTHPYLTLADAGTTARSLTWSSLDKHRRWLERRGAVRIEVLDDPGQVLDAFETLARFLSARWRGQPQASALEDVRRLRFHRRALPLLLAERRLRMLRLSVDLRTVAVFYGLASGGWWGYYLAGYDGDWAGRIHLGQITLATAIEAALKERAGEFDFLKGTERVKYLWPVRERMTIDADLYSTSAGPQLTRAARAGREAGAALVKSARALVAGSVNGKNPAVR